MKQEIFCYSLAIVLVTGIGTTGIAGEYDAFIHFVNHRDANGKLVFPQKPRVSPTLAGPQAKPMPSSYETPNHSMTPLSSVSPQAASQTQLSPEPQLTPVPNSMPYGQGIENHSPEPNVPYGSNSTESMGLKKIGSNVRNPTAPEPGMGDQSPTVETGGVIKKTSIPEEPQSYAFRSTNWGMSVPEVKTTESAELDWELDATILAAGEYRLGYQTDVEGIEAYLTYAFEQSQLTKAKYLFETNEVQGEAQPLLHYKTVKKWIVQTYGPPQSEEKLWVNELYRYAPELWGRALMRGHLTIVDEWDIDGTSIVLILNGGEETVGLMAEFTTKDLSSPTQVVHVPTRFFDFL